MCAPGKSKSKTTDAAKKKAELEKRLQVSVYQESVWCVMVVVICRM